MLKGITTILLMTGCLLGARALPTRASSFGSALRRLDSSQRPARGPLLDSSLPTVGMDQSAEESSIVDDFVPSYRNQLDFKRYQYGYPDFYKYKSQEDTSHIQESSNIREQRNDCFGCELTDGVVTLGESRSFSVVTAPQTTQFVASEYTETTTQATVDDSTVTSWRTALPDEITEELTTEAAEQLEGKIISVRISSSVGKSVQPEPAALQVEDRPFATAVQRSHFSVEEAMHEPLRTSESVQTADSFEPSKYVTLIDRLPPSTSTAIPQLGFSSTSNTIGRYPTPSNDRSDRSLYHRKHMYSVTSESTRDLQGSALKSMPQTQAQVVVLSDDRSPPLNPLSSPVSYHTSLQSATSGSRVSFFREPPILRSSKNTSPPPSTQPSLVEPHTNRLKHETRVETVSFHEEVVRESPINDSNSNVNEQKSYQFTNVHDQSFHHVQVTHLNENKRPASSRGNHHQPEKVYGMPEQNYEVDEGLSVRSNGRAHGIQGTAHPDNNKFGYVVEGRDFKKYRVEERTADGFIVGEYGVVRHDDGSTRGVRYTADSNINPKVIYEALVKFLSL